MSLAYEEIVDFMARLGPREIASFHASEAASQRVSDLISKEKHGSITTDEQRELDDYLRLEHLMRMVKARARLHLANE